MSQNEQAKTDMACPPACTGESPAPSNKTYSVYLDGCDTKIVEHDDGPVAPNRYGSFRAAKEVAIKFMNVHIAFGQFLLDRLRTADSFELNEYLDEAFVEGVLEDCQFALDRLRAADSYERYEYPDRASVETEMNSGTGTT